MQATIFDMQRFSVHDGPGIRTTVFFKGCNLRCFWCHNPESIDPRPEVQFLSLKCIGCGKCFHNCPKKCHVMRGGERVFTRELCDGCGICVDECYAEALNLMGRRYSVEQVIDVVERDIPFYKNSGGGMTCSGGEPMLQWRFVAELLQAARAKGIHTAVDTAGNVPFAHLEAVMPHTDLFLYDLKCMDEQAHREAVGTGNARIKENIRKLSEAGAKIWVRIPVIPGVNDTLENMRETAALVAPLRGVEKVELLTFHRLGGGKYESLGKTYDAADMQPASKEEMQALALPFSDRNVEVKVS